MVVELEYEGQVDVGDTVVAEVTDIHCACDYGGRRGDVCVTREARNGRRCGCISWGGERGSAGGRDRARRARRAWCGRGYVAQRCSLDHQVVNAAVVVRVSADYYIIISRHHSVPKEGEDAALVVVGGQG